MKKVSLILLFIFVGLAVAQQQNNNGQRFKDIVKVLGGLEIIERFLKNMGQGQGYGNMLGNLSTHQTQGSYFNNLKYKFQCNGAANLVAALGCSTNTKESNCLTKAQDFTSAFQTAQLSPNVCNQINDLRANLTKTWQDRTVTQGNDQQSDVQGMKKFRDSFDKIIKIESTLKPLSSKLNPTCSDETKLKSNFQAVTSCMGWKMPNVGGRNRDGNGGRTGGNGGRTGGTGGRTGGQGNSQNRN